MLTEFFPLLILGVGALFAGFIDSVVGGGGLIQIPVLFTTLSSEVPATLFGTNKIASIFGTGNAAFRYMQRVRIPWRTLVPATLAAFVFAFLGAMSVAWLPRELLRADGSPAVAPSPELARRMQEIVWEVVTSIRETGVPPGGL